MRVPNGSRCDCEKCGRTLWSMPATIAIEVTYTICEPCKTGTPNPTPPAIQDARGSCGKCSFPMASNYHTMVCVPLHERHAPKAESSIDQHPVVVALREELKDTESECEKLARFFEQFGDLSCCYDAEDVVNVGQTWIEERLAEVTRLTEALEKIEVNAKVCAFATRTDETVSKAFEQLMENARESLAAVKEKRG